MPRFVSIIKSFQVDKVNTWQCCSNLQTPIWSSSRQERNQNMNNKDHLAGFLTRLTIGLGNFFLHVFIQLARLVSPCYHNPHTNFPKNIWQSFQPEDYMHFSDGVLCYTTIQFSDKAPLISLLTCCCFVFVVVVFFVVVFLCCFFPI